MKRLNIVTLGVKDLSSSKTFFSELFDWSPVNEEENIAFYNMGGWYFALYPKLLLAEDITISPDGSGFSGITLAHNVSSKSEVNECVSKAISLGAKLVKEPQDVFWGGYSGYFQDLDGHYWEVAWNPFTPIKADGTLHIKD